jgi:hypothetical protein
LLSEQMHSWAPTSSALDAFVERTIEHDSHRFGVVERDGNCDRWIIYDREQVTFSQIDVLASEFG